MDLLAWKVAEVGAEQAGLKADKDCVSHRDTFVRGESSVNREEGVQLIHTVQNLMCRALLALDSLAEKQFLLDLCRLIQGVCEALAHSFDAEDCLGWQMNQNILYELGNREHFLANNFSCGSFSCFAGQRLSKYVLRHRRQVNQDASDQLRRRENLLANNFNDSFFCVLRCFVGQILIGSQCRLLHHLVSIITLVW
jgi:hypothetical protein